MQKHTKIAVAAVVGVFLIVGAFAYAQYQTKVYREQGGEKLCVANGGEIEIQSGGTIDIESGGYFKLDGTAVTATAAEINTATDSPTGTNYASYTIDADSSAAKIKLDTASATGDFTLTLRPSNLGANRTITFPDSTGTVQVSAYTDLDLGSSGAAGTLDVFPSTVTSGKTQYAVADNAADHTLTITNESFGQATTLEYPDVGTAAGQFVCTSSDFSVVVDPNAADRAISLTGDLTLAGTLTTGAALTFSGAHAAQFTVPSASTWVLPTGGGTLATVTGAETGTTASTFTVDSDSVTGKLAVTTTSGGTNHTITLTNTAPTADRTITLPNLTGTVALLGGTQTFTGDKTLTGTADFQGDITASTGDPSIDWSSSTGAFTTSTGANTLSGDVTISGTKTLTTGTGAIALNGDVTIAATKDLVLNSGGGSTGYFRAMGKTSGGIEIQAIDTGTALTTLANQNVAAATITLPDATATLATIGLAETLDTKGLTNAADITQTGATTITSGTTGMIIPDANTAGLSIHAASSKGSLRFKAVDNTGDTITDITNELQAGARTYKIPDAGASGQFVMTNTDQTLVCAIGAADRTITLAGNITTTGDFTTATAANITLTANAAGSAVTLPASGTLASVGGTETLTAKTIDGDDNTIQDLLAVSTKTAVGGTTGVEPTPVFPVIMMFTPTNGAGETLVYTVPAGKTFRVLWVHGYKTNGNGGAGDTVTVQNVGNAITDAIDLQINDKLIFAAASYDDAQRNIAATTELRIVTAFNTDCACVVIVIGIWV